MLLNRSNPLLLSTIIPHQIRWATNLGGSGTKNGRDSIGKRLGVKRGHGALVAPGEVLVKQRGFEWHPGHNVAIANLNYDLD